MKPLAISIIIVNAVLLLVLYFVRDTISGFFKDLSSQPDQNKPFSLSRVLFAFWTLLVFFALSYIGIYTGKLPEIEQCTLTLMGIAIGTSAAGRAVDNIQAGNQNMLRTQDSPTQGFLTDILSDSNGVSISRFQTLGFNLIYGAVFLSTVFTDQKIYHFDNLTLTLLGLSSGAYALLKIPEAQAQ